MILARLRSAAALFARQALRDGRRHRVLALLNIGSVALGIAVFLAIRIAMHSANKSFTAGMDLVVGKSELEIRGAVADEVFPRVSSFPEVKACTPLVEGLLTLPDFPGEYLQVVGVDLFSNQAFRTIEMGQRFDVTGWLGAPNAVALTREFAQRHGLRVGDKLRGIANARLQELTVFRLLDSADTPAETNSRFAVMDIGWAQELMGMRGRFSSIQVILKEPQKAEKTARRIRELLPPGLRVEAPGQRSFQVQKMLSAFELNLTALSMVSLLVGMFLIYNTVSASVARRTSEIGILRALGASRSQVRWLFLGEALLFALPGVALGVLGGVALAQGLLGVISKTISSLYIVLSIYRFYLDPLHVLSALALGIVTALAGAWVPAHGAAQVNPVDAIGMQKRYVEEPRHALRWALGGIMGLASALACAWLAIAGVHPWLSFCAAFLVLVGAAALAPAVITFGGRALGGIFRRMPIVRMAAHNLRRSLGRNAMTVGALSTAVAMMSAVAVMILSFRQTVDLWIQSGMTADIFMTPAANELAGAGALIPPPALEFLKQMPEVESVETYREAQVVFSKNGSPAQQAALAVVGGDVRRKMRFVGGSDSEKAKALFSGKPLVALSESFSRKLGVREGEALTLETPDGLLRVQVVGIYYDYSRDSGIMMIYAPLFMAHWRDAGVQSMAAHLRDKADTAKVAEGFRARMGGAGEFAIYSNSELKKRVLNIFDQTFAVTHVLRVIAVAVAVAGLLLSLTTLVTERRREIGLLRSLGASGRQIQALFLAEAAMVGCMAGGLGVLGGMGLAWVLTAAVNPAFFGWTIQLSFPVGTLVFTPVWMTLLALPAAWWPARVAARTPIAAAVRSE